MNNILNTDNLEQLDKKIIIKYKKIRGKNKTCIYGLEKIINGDKLNDFLKNIKKKLACGGVITEDDDKVYMIEFMGDHRIKIKNIIIEEKLLAENKIELKGA